MMLTVDKTSDKAKIADLCERRDSMTTAANQEPSGKLHAGSPASRNPGVEIKVDNLEPSKKRDTFFSQRY